MTNKKTQTIPLQPIGDRVVIEPIPVELKSASGLILQSATEGEKPNTGTVVAVGPGKTDEDGNYIKMQVSVGDTVLFQKNDYTMEHFTYRGTDYCITKEESLLAIIKQ